MAGIAVAGALLAGCASSSDRATVVSLTALETPTPVLADTASGASDVKCSNPTASLRPPSAMPAPRQMPARSFMRKIQRRGSLIAGVDQNTLLFAYLNPFTGNIQGFEIDLLRQIAKAILGKPKIEFEAITTAQRQSFVQTGRVDIVADAYTINCDRLRYVDFSTVYYDAGQRLLVPKTSHVRGIGDLSGEKVCVTKKGTARKYLATYAADHPKRHPIRYQVDQRTDCLVALQQGAVAAIASDDAILLGFARQDPYTKLVGPRFTDEPYGMAISKSHPDFVRFVNGVLARVRADGTWSALYRKWLGSVARTRPAPHALYRG
jgi:polar amino acid transport system substrate-binding protein